MSKIFLLKWHKYFCITFAVILSIILGFIITRNGITSVDDNIRYHFSVWLLGKYNLVEDNGLSNEIAIWYAPIWDLFLALNTEFIFKFLNDPHWVRHALTWALYPLTLLSTYILLRKAYIPKSTAFLSTALLFSCIRFGGFVSQTKDFPVACAYILVPIAMWIILYKKKSENVYTQFSLKEVLLLTLLAFLPYLLRPPILLYFAVLILLFILYSIANRKQPIASRILIIGIPILVALLFSLLLFPAMWEYSLISIKTWIKPIIIFSNFPHKFTQFFFANRYKPSTLPWWYIFAWLPVFMHPIGSAVLITGLLLLFKKSKQKLASFLVPIGKSKINISFIHWYAGMLFLSWLLIFVTKPILYDGMRHILFIYAPLPVLAGLGFKSTPKKLQITLAVILIAVSIPTYVKWNRYSYIYTPSFAPYTESSHFMGETRMLCIAKAIDFVKDYAEDGDILVYRVPIIAQLQINRYKNNILLKNKHFPKVVLTNRQPKYKKYLEIKSSRYEMTNINSLKRDINIGKSKILWKDTLPTGEFTCLVTENKLPGSYKTNNDDNTYLYEPGM